MALPGGQHVEFCRSRTYSGSSLAVTRSINTNCGECQQVRLRKVKLDGFNVYIDVGCTRDILGVRRDDAEPETGME